MTTQEVTNSLYNLIEITLPLANANPVPQEGTQYLRLLEGLFRKNNIRLQSIHMLSQHPATSNTALEIVRNMAEDVIGIEYVFANGKEKMAKKLFNYLPVQLHNELEFAKKIGIETGDDEFPETEKKIMQDYSKLSASVKRRKNWAGISFEDMLANLEGKNALSKRDTNLIGLLYLEGSRKTHLNPYDVSIYLGGDTFYPESEQTLRKVLVYSISSYIKLTTRYIDEISEVLGKATYHDIAQQVLAIFNEYDTPDATID